MFAPKNPTKCEGILVCLERSMPKEMGEKLDVHQRNGCFGDVQASERSQMNNMLTSFDFSMLRNHVLPKAVVPMSMDVWKTLLLLDVNSLRKFHNGTR